MNRSYFQLLILIPVLILLAAACSEQADAPAVPDADAPLSERVDFLIAQDRYEQALSLLEGENRQDQEILRQFEKVHLNYGLNSMSTFDPNQMRTRMNNALVQFTEVLRINPNNQMARQQIEQIMDVYATMPDRGPDEEVLEGLREVGYSY
ncbi:MAG: hypothetical protein ACNA78_08570 [Balneolaceae bacterium]